MSDHEEVKAVIRVLKKRYEGHPMQKKESGLLALRIVTVICCAIFAACVWLLSGGRLFLITLALLC